MAGLFVAGKAVACFSRRPLRVEPAYRALPSPPVAHRTLINSDRQAGVPKQIGPNCCQPKLETKDYAIVPASIMKHQTLTALLRQQLDEARNVTESIRDSVKVGFQHTRQWVSDKAAPESLVDDSIQLKRRAAVAKIAIVLCSTVLAQPITYAQPSVSVAVNVRLPSVEIRTASDFYDPLTPYGRWATVGSYGRCWIPGRVESGWRPYCNGYWQSTEAGWYWASDEPWAWATYHYGRWDLSPQFGWYWLPQTQWAPAWVSWHSGGGYIGWAPLYPPGVRVISPRAYVFVEERHFMEPVRVSAVVANSTTIINKTVIKEAPATSFIEKASGRKVQAVAVQELRHREEATVIAKQPTPSTTSEKKVHAQVRSEALPGDKGAAVAHTVPQVEKPAATTQAPATSATKNSKAQSEPRKSAPAAVQSRPAAKSKADHPTAVEERAQPKTSQPTAKQEKPIQPPDENAPRVSERPTKESPDAREKDELKSADKNRGNKGKE